MVKNTGKRLNPFLTPEAAAALRSPSIVPGQAAPGGYGIAGALAKQQQQQAQVLKQVPAAAAGRPQTIKVGGVDDCTTLLETLRQKHSQQRLVEAQQGTAGAAHPLIGASYATHSTTSVSAAGGRLALQQRHPLPPTQTQLAHELSGHSAAAIISGTVSPVSPVSPGATSIVSRLSPQVVSPVSPSSPGAGYDEEMLAAAAAVARRIMAPASGKSPIPATKVGRQAKGLRTKSHVTRGNGGVSFAASVHSPPARRASLTTTKSLRQSLDAQLAATVATAPAHTPGAPWSPGSADDAPSAMLGASIKSAPSVARLTTPIDSSPLKTHRSVRRVPQAVADAAAAAAAASAVNGAHGDGGLTGGRPSLAPALSTKLVISHSMHSAAHDPSASPLKPVRSVRRVPVPVQVDMEGDATTPMARSGRSTMSRFASTTPRELQDFRVALFGGQTDEEDEEGEEEEEEEEEKDSESGQQHSAASSDSEAPLGGRASDVLHAPYIVSDDEEGSPTTATKSRANVAALFTSPGGPRSTRSLIHAFDHAAMAAEVQQDHWSPGPKAAGGTRLATEGSWSPSAAPLATVQSIAPTRTLYTGGASASESGAAPPALAEEDAPPEITPPHSPTTSSPQRIRPHAAGAGAAQLAATNAGVPAATEPAPAVVPASGSLASSVPAEVEDNEWDRVPSMQQLAEVDIKAVAARAPSVAWIASQAAQPPPRSPVRNLRESFEDATRAPPPKPAPLDQEVLPEASVSHGGLEFRFSIPQHEDGGDDPAAAPAPVLAPAPAPAPVPVPAPAVAVPLQALAVNNAASEQLVALSKLLATVSGMSGALASSLTSLVGAPLLSSLPRSEAAHSTEEVAALKTKVSQLEQQVDALRRDLQHQQQLFGQLQLQLMMQHQQLQTVASARPAAAGADTAPVVALLQQLLLAAAPALVAAGRPLNASSVRETNSVSTPAVETPLPGLAMVTPDVAHGSHVDIDTARVSDATHPRAAVEHPVARCLLFSASPDGQVQPADGTAAPRDPAASNAATAATVHHDQAQLDVLPMPLSHVRTRVGQPKPQPAEQPVVAVPISTRSPGVHPASAQAGRGTAGLMSPGFKSPAKRLHPGMPPMSPTSWSGPRSSASAVAAKLAGAAPAVELTPSKFSLQTQLGLVTSMLFGDDDEGVPEVNGNAAPAAPGSQEQQKRDKPHPA